MQPIRGKSTVSTSSNVEIGRLKKEERRKKMNNLAVELVSSLVLQRNFFASLTVLLLAEQPNMKVRCL